MMIKLAFWISVCLILYHHIGYPLACRAIVARLPRRPKPTRSLFAPPSVTLIVPAHNEEAVIAEKIRNLAQLDYPRDRLTVVLALDGCTDATAALAREALKEAGQLDLRIVEYVPNIGKLAVLNDQIARTTSEIVALSDTSALLDPEALRSAVRHFEGSDIGVVCPGYALSRPGSEGERAYWDYQTRLKVIESTIGAPMGAHGAFYLFRRNLWEPLESDTINDDFILPMRIIRKGYGAVYDPSVVARELEMSTTRQDFHRRIRISAGNLQQAFRLAGLADPRRPGIAFVFLSGKALRAFVPFLGLIAALTLPILALKDGGFYRYAILGEVGFITAAVTGIWSRPGRVPRPALWAGYFVQGYAAGFLGALILLLGLHGEAWKLSKSARAKAHATPVAAVEPGKNALVDGE